MSKAEKFILDNVIDSDDSSDIIIYYKRWITPDAARKAVEIAKEEIYEWLQENASKYIEKQDTMFGTIKVLNSHKLVNDLKQAMNYE